MIVERPALERRLLASLDAGRIPVLLGGCGTGRTSLLLRLETLLGRERSQYLDFAAAASTPERCLGAVRAAVRAPWPAGSAAPSTPKQAFLDLMDGFDRSPSPAGGPLAWLLDEFADVRVFENFPGLRDVQRDTIARMAASPAAFVLASRFTSRVHRLLRDAPARFEVVHMPPLEPAEGLAMALRLDGRRRDAAAELAAAAVALAAGRAGAVHLLLEAVAAMGPALDPVAGLASALAPDGRLTARCRESFELRLNRARGYGALKAILAILADEEPLNLTEIATRLSRTPGSTKDYLSWLEDVDLIVSQGKKYTFDDPILRLYVRIHGRPVPATDDDIVREVGAYARARLAAIKPVPAAPNAAPAAAPVAVPATPATAAAAVPTRSADSAADEGRGSGIIEID